MIVPVFLPHLGCRSRCTYCNQDIITDIKQKGGLEAHLSALLGGLDSPAEVALYSGNMLGLPPERLETLFRAFEPYRDRITAFRLSAKPGPVTTHHLEVLKKYRVRTVELGIPTFNDRILVTLNRGHTREDLLETYRLLSHEGFEVGLQVMVGLPDEEAADLRETAVSIAHLAPAFIRVYPLLVIEGTPLAQAYREGTFSPESLERAVTKAAFLYITAWRLGIPTIKMGLSENEVLKNSILAGPYHPAFGYLVKCEAFYCAVVKKWEELAPGGEAELLVNKADVAHVTGHRRSNLKRLRDRGIHLTWKEGLMAEGEFILQKGARKVGGRIDDALAMLPF